MPQDCFFTRGEYQQLVYQALAGLPGLEIVPPSDDIRTLPPAILKPVQRWTGKQVPTNNQPLFFVFFFLYRFFVEVAASMQKACPSLVDRKVD